MPDPEQPQTRPDQDGVHPLQAAREARRSPSGVPGLCMSRRELAEAANAYLWKVHQRRENMTEHDIGRYERGEVHWPRHERRLALRGVLGADTDIQLGFYPNRTKNQHVEDAEPTPGAKTVSDRLADEDNRSVHATGPSVTPYVAADTAGPPPSKRDNRAGDPIPAVDNDLARAVPAVPEPLAEVTPDWTYPVGADRGWVAMLRWAIPDDAITDAAHQLVDARSHRGLGSHIDPQLIQCVLAASEGYRRSYHAVPASRLLPAALAHLDLVMSLRPANLPDRERMQLITAAGEMAALVGVLLALDASRYGEALRYLDLAWTAARTVRDAELQSVVLGCRSFAISYGTGDHRAGLDCADFAREVAATGASPPTRAWVAAVASERSASLGDYIGCRHRLDESETLLSAPNAAGVSWRGIGGYDATKLRAYEGGDLMRLGRYQDAEPILDDALTRLRIEMTRHRATALLDRAEARFGLGEVDAACDDAGLALGLVAHVQHTGHLDRIESLARRGIRARSRAARSLHHDLQLTRIDHGLSIRIGVA